MGQEIVYCSVCQTRLLEADFEKRKAYRIDHRVCCKKCSPRFIESLPTSRRVAALQAMAEPDAPPLPPSTPKKGTERIGKIPAPHAAEPQSGGVGGIAVAVVAVVVLAVAALIFGSGSSAKPSVSPGHRAGYSPEDHGSRPTGVVEPPALPPPAREEKSAALAIRKAREFLKAEPEKIDETLALYEDAVWEARGTSQFDDIKKEFDALQRKQSDRIQSELAPVLEEARTARNREEFGRALEVLQKAVGRHPWRDWSATLQRQVRESRGDLDDLYAAAKDKAAQARRGGDEAAAAAELQRVRKWAMPDLAADLEKHLASIKPAPVPSAEAKAYRTAWAKAIHATWSRAYADAVRELDAAVKPLKEAAEQAEATADLEALRAAGRVPTEALQLLSKTPVGQKAGVEVEDPSGNVVKVEGTVTRISATGIEVKAEAGATRVDFCDLTAATLVEIFRGRPGRNAEADARAIRLFLALEGEEAAEDANDAALARLVAEAKRHASASWRDRENAARSLFSRAEREFEDNETRFGSAEKYGALLSKHGDTRLVLRRRAEIGARLEAARDAAKDYVFFPGEMRSGGMFQTVTHKKGEVAVTLQSDQASIKDHFVDLVFTALPDVEYKGWALVGACCAETFAHGLQGSELTGPSPSGSGEKIAAEPGTAGWLAGKAPTVFLKRLHSQHGGPKIPARWEWVPLAIPKYATGGRKSFRILSGQQGFSVRAAVIGVARTAPLTDADFKEIEKARLAVLQKPAPARDPSLVAHWKLDDGTGTSVVDSSGSGLNGTVKNGASWTSGRIGGALSLNGSNQFVDVGSTAKLFFKGPFTLALWANLADVGRDKYYYFLGDYTAKGDQSSMALRCFKTGQAQFFWEYPPGTWNAASSKTILTAGKWTHVAGTWDGTTRKIYLNGALEGMDATPQQRPPAMGSLSIGRCGAFEGLNMYGELDDVRIYSRALADTEIQALVKGAPRK